MVEQCPVCKVAMDGVASGALWVCPKCGDLWQATGWGWAVLTKDMFVPFGCLGVFDEAGGRPEPVRRTREAVVFRKIGLL